HAAASPYFVMVSLDNDRTEASQRVHVWPRACRSVAAAHGQVAVRTSRSGCSTSARSHNVPLGGCSACLEDAEASNKVLVRGGRSRPRGSWAKACAYHAWEKTCACSRLSFSCHAVCRDSPPACTGAGRLS